MKNMFRKYQKASLIAILFIAIVGMFSSCEREPLTIGEYGNSFDLVIRPRWIELDERPTGFTAMIYPTEGGEPTTVISNNVDSVCVSLKAGSYRVLIFNQTISEYESIGFRHMESYYDSEIMLTENTEDVNKYNIFPRCTLANEPAVFAADCCNELTVNTADVTSASKKGRRVRKVLTMRPHIIISTLYVNLNVEGIYNGMGVEGCIDGMSGNVFPTYYEAGEKYGAYVIKEWSKTYDGISRTTGKYQGKIRLFGMPGTSLYLQSAASIETQDYAIDAMGSRATSFKLSRSESDPQFKPEDMVLHMRVLLVDKKTVYQQDFAVGDLIERRINDPLILDLNVKEWLTLPYVQPADGTGASGFDADVDDWQVIDCPIQF